MTKVVFYELECPKDLKRVERKINAAVARILTPAPIVRLFQSQGEVVYSIQGLPVVGGTRTLDTVETLIRQELG